MKAPAGPISSACVYRQIFSFQKATFC
jgi:hypothetical protein